MVDAVVLFCLSVYAVVFFVDVVVLFCFDLLIS